MVLQLRAREWEQASKPFKISIFSKDVKFTKIGKIMLKTVVQMQIQLRAK